MKILRVLDWDENYENSKSRERKECSFVCVPNKQSGLGFARIMERPDGPAIYGIWCLLLGALSRQKRMNGNGREGWMTHDGKPTGTPWSTSDLALLWRRSSEEIQNAIAFLSSKDVGWIDCIEVFDNKEQAGDARELPANCPNGIVKEGIERKKELPPNPQPRLPKTVEEAISGCGGAGVPEAFIKEVFLEHEGTAWTYAGKPVTNFKSYVSSRWMRTRDIQAQREKYMTAPKKPIHKSAPMRQPTSVPAWMAQIEHAKRMLADPDPNQMALAVIGHALPREAWGILDGVKEQNPIRAAMKLHPKT